MMLGDLDWHRFANGDFITPVRVCRLPRSDALLIGAPDDRLLITPQYAPKLVFKHNLTEHHLKLMPLAVSLGALFRDKDGSLIYAYDDQVITGRMFLLVVKLITEKHELWVRSFYNVRNREYERKRRRFDLIRPQN